MGLQAGMSYTRTEQVTLPLTPGVYEFYVLSDSGKVLADTNFANNLLNSAPLTITLRPRPDLEVTSLTVPQSVSAGSVIDVQWQVTNVGQAATPTGQSQWTDAVYLSLENKLDSNAILLGTLSNGNALGVGESYSSSDQFTLPQGIAGDVYVVVEADSQDQVDEGPMHGNNTAVAALAVNAQAVLPPDLVMSNVFVPSTVFDGNAVTVHYQVANLGTGPTCPSSWEDAVWLTLGDDGPDPQRGDMLLGEFAHTGALAVGQSYENNVTVNVPPQISGQYYITVLTDADQSVYEVQYDVNKNPDAPNNLHGDNFNAAPVTVLLTPPADLQVSNVAAPATAVGGSQVTLSWEVVNNGPNPTNVGQWADAVYINSTPDLSGDPTLVFAVPHVGILAPGQSYDQTVTFTLPPSATGQYFVVETNANPALAEVPDQDALFLQQIQQVVDSAGDTLNGQSISNLTAQDILDLLSGNGSAPTTVFEGPWGNNDTAAAASTITNTPADLVVGNVTAPAQSNSGEPINVTWQVSNQGADVWPGTQSWNDCVFLSPDPEFIYSDATLAAVVPHSNANGLAGGESYQGSATITLPAGISGTEYVYVFSDRDPHFGEDAPSAGAFPGWLQEFQGRVWETDMDNNVSSTSVNVACAEPELVISSVTAAAAAKSGSTVPIGFTVTNDGNRATRVDTWFDRVYIATDASLDTQDELLGTFEHQGFLDPGQSYTVTGNVTLPEDIGGTFYLIFYADSPYTAALPLAKGIYPFPEAGGDPRIAGGGPGPVDCYLNGYLNIESHPIQVTAVAMPDLAVTSVSSSQQVTVGQAFSVSYTVTNIGTGAVPANQAAWTDNVYLSRDQYLDASSAVFLGTVPSQDDALAPNGSYTVSTQFGVPAGLSGAYYVIVLTDPPSAWQPQGVVVESSEGNNATASTVPMLIELPPPTDLQVDSISVPAAATAGQPVTISYTVSNHSSVPAVGSWSDSVYLSPDPTFDTNAQLIGTCNEGNLGGAVSLAQGQGYAGSVTATLPPELPGNYYVLVYANVFNTVYEGANYANNVLTAPSQLTVTVPTLTLGMPLVDTISSGQSRLYAVQVPADQTLEVNLTGSDPNGANELYAKFQGLPSSLNYDAAYQGHLIADQTITVPTTEPGTYYILVRGDSDAADTSIQLNAELLPFQVDDISPDGGGDSQYVTVTVTGDDFSPQAIVKLVRPQIAEFSPVSYNVVDATQIVATFDLADAPLGLYDVEVINPDGSTAIQPYRFLVEPAEPINVTVGMGGPSTLNFGQTGVYLVSMHSITNVDTPYVFFEYGVLNVANPASALIPGPALAFSTDLSGQPDVSGVLWPDLSSVVNLSGQFEAQGFAFDMAQQSTTTLSFTVQSYPGLPQVLAQDPSFLNNLTPYEIEELSFPFHIEAAATPMTAAEYVTYQTNLADQIRTAILADSSAPAVLKLAAANQTDWEDGYLQALEDTGQLRPADMPPAALATPAVSSLMSVLGAGILGGAAGQSLISAGNLDAFFSQVLSWYGNTPAATGSGGLPSESAFDLQLSHPTHFEAFQIQVGQPLEESAATAPNPNLADYFGITAMESQDVAMTGPSGSGSSNFVPAGTPLPYSVTFNSPVSGQGPQSQVRIVEQLDPNLDLRTFQLSDIALDGVTIVLPAGRGSFTGSFDLTSQWGFIFDVTAGVDVDSGTATWLLTAIDPSTGLPSADPSLSIMPAGQSGTVGYTIQALSTATTGTALSAAARVIYDSQQPLDTNTVSATLDATPPTTDFSVTDLGNSQYYVQWQATDGPTGSGVASSTVYVSVDGGGWQPVDQYSTAGSFSYQGAAGTTAEFLVLSADNAGNVEASPAGILVPPYDPQINLGSLPSPPLQTASLPAAPAPTQPSTNPLFLAAEQGVPAPTSAVNPPAFTTVLEPLAAGAFVSGFAASGAGISPLGIAFSPDGQSVYVSGGAGRNSLWEFTRAGGSAATTAPLATLAEPIYDMAFDSNGQLWATSGGGPLLQLDPNSGQIVASYGEGIELGLAADPHSDILYVASSDGIQIFNTVTHVFQPFSSTRVEALAIAPDGTLWGTTWPYGGQIVRFDAHGNATAAVALSDPANGLAFGHPGTPLANLLFATHADGTLSMVDLVTGQSLTVASGGQRGAFAHVGPDGRLYITQSDQIDVFSPLLPPQVVAVNPAGGAQIAPGLNTAEVTFDGAMLANLAANSVTDAANYVLTDATTGQQVSVSAVTCDSSGQTAELWFDPLLPGSYSLQINPQVENVDGLALGSAYQSQFTVAASGASTLLPTISNTRLDRQLGQVFFDISVQNTLNIPVNAPLQVIFTNLPATGDTLLEPDGFTSDGHPYIELSAAGGQLAPNQSTATRTLSLPAAALYSDLGIEDMIQSGVVVVPAVSSAPPTTATVGQVYQYDASATDSSGATVTYALIQAPPGATVDPQSGEVLWTPQASDSATVGFALRAYDPTGGYSQQTWSVTVSGVSPPPVLSPIPDQTIAEGQLLDIPIATASPSGKPLVLWADNLPPGAIFDPQGQTLIWQTGYTSAGVYCDVRIYASDGITTSFESFQVTVTSVTVAPQLGPLPARVVQEGNELSLTVAASDANGNAITFSSDNLPSGATLDPTSGLFDWTPGYDQHGSYAIDITASASGLSTTDQLQVTVLNVDGPISFLPVGRLTVYEGQTLSTLIGVDDPNLPNSLPYQLPDGATEPGAPLSPLTFGWTALPAGASFNPISATLTWTPGYAQAGNYSITFTVHDDGDGTGGTPQSARITLPITVLPAVGAPVVNPVSDQSLAEGNALTIPVTAADPSGEPLTIAAQGLPSFAMLTDNHDGTATISVDPTTGDRGNYTVTVTATDNGDGNPADVLSGSAQFVLSVTSFSEPPVLSYIGPMVAVIGQTLTFNVTASEMDQDPLAFSVQGLPADATLTPTGVYGVAQFQWTPTAAEAGSYSATFTVANNGNGNPALAQSVSRVVNFVVCASDAPPVLLPVSNASVTQGQPLAIQLQAADPDGNPLAFTASPMPSGATFDPSSGLFIWTPSIAQTGEFTVHFAATDGFLSDGQNVDIQVAPAAIPPTFAPLPPVLGKEGTPLSFSVSAGDLDGAALVYSLAAPLPAHAAFDPTTQAFTWTPAFGQAGQYDLEFAATDPANDASATEEVAVTILKTDQPPVLPALGGHVALIGKPFQLTITGTSPEANVTLSYSATGLPAEATLNPSTGLLSWTPSGVQAGAYDMLVTVSDGTLSATQPLRLVASATPLPPSVLITLTPSFPAPAGQPVVIQVTASGIANVSSIALSVDGQPLQLNAHGSATFVPPTPGHYSLVATATDMDGQVGTATSDLKVRDLSDTSSPVVELSVPPTGTVLSAPAAVVGTVSDSNLDDYQLTLEPLGSSTAIVLASGQANVDDAALATIDPGKLANGAYLLQLTATNISGRTSSATSLVEINTTTKSGSFAASATDLTATLDGVSVRFTRYYQSVAAASAGLTGNGWQLAGFDPRIATDVAPSPSQSSGVYNAFQIGTRLYINLPDGTRARFVFTPTSASVGPLTIYQPAWTAAAGYQLSTAAAQLENDGGSLDQFGTGLPYNPASGRFGNLAWTLTAPDGTRYDYSPAGTLLDIVSPGGVTLVASNSGLVAPNGQRVTFRTNAAGRIAALIGPDGSQVLYSYDSSGNLIRVNDLDSDTASFYQYNAANQLTAAVQPGGSSTAVVYDANGNLQSVDPINQNLGTTRQFLGQSFAEAHVAGATDRYSFILSNSELASVLAGSVIIGIDVGSSAGFNPALPTIDGLAPIYSSVQAGHSVALYRLPAGGAYVVSVTGATAAASGVYKLQVYLPGDVNGDGRVDGTDEQLFDAALGTSPGQPGYVAGADVEHNGVVNEQDYLILESNFGFTADQPPVAQSTTIDTREGVPVTVDLSTLAGDPQGQLIGFTLSNPQDGTVTLALDGHSATFTPAAGFSGAAQFSFTAADPSAFSSIATVTVNVATATLADIEFGQKDLQLNVGQTAVLSVTGLYVDGTTGGIPAGQVVFGSANPAVATVGPNGAILTLAAGQTVLTATVDGLTAATPLTVGTNSAPETLSFFPSTYALTVGQARQFQVLELMSDGTQSDVSSGADGTVYYVSNPALGTISPDGLFTATALGSELVTVIQDGQSEVATLTITTPVTGGTAVVRASGAIVSDADGTLLGVGPGALPAGTQITVGSLAEADLPAVMPSGFNYGQGFTLDTGGLTASDPLSVAIAATAGSQAGDALYLFRWGELLEANFQIQPMWELVDEMVVGSDGMARSASLPYPGVLITGDYAVGVPATQPGIVDGTMGPGAGAEVIMPGSGSDGPLTALPAGHGVIRPAGEPVTLFDGSWYMLPNIVGTLVAPIVVKGQQMFLDRVNNWGVASQATAITVQPGLFQKVDVSVPLPAPVAATQPIITGFSLSYDSTDKQAVLSISGTGFDTTDATNDLVYIIPGPTPDLSHVPSLDDLGLVAGVTGKYAQVPAGDVWLDDGQIGVEIPKGVAIGGSSICVVVKGTITPVPPGAVRQGEKITFTNWY